MGACVVANSGGWPKFKKVAAALRRTDAIFQRSQEIHGEKKPVPTPQKPSVVVVVAATTQDKLASAIASLSLLFCY